MKRHPRGIAVASMLAIAVATPGCTLVGIGVASGTTAIHNSAADQSSQWGYTAPILIGAAVGLIVDFLFFDFLQHQWAKPMT